MKLNIRSYIQFLAWMKHYWALYPWLNLLNLLLGVLGVALSLCFVYLFKAAIDIATGANPGNLALILGCYVGGTILQRVITFVGTWTNTILFTKTENDMRISVFSKLMFADWLQLQNYHSGDIQGRISKDVESLVAMTTNTFPAIVTMLCQLFGAALFLCFLDYRLVLVLLVITPIIYLLRRLYIDKQRELSKEVRDEEAQVLSHYQEATQHFLVIKTHQAYDFLLKRLHKQQSSLESKVRQKLIFSIRPFLLMRLGFDLTYLIVFVWGVISLKNHWITYGTVMAYVQLVARVQSPLRNLSQYVNSLIQGHIAFERIVDLERLPPEDKLQESRAEKCLASPQILQKMRAGECPFVLSLSNISYRYNSDARIVLNNFSGHFPQGSITAIVGETGAGKTTLIRLLLGLLSPQQGKMEWLLDNHVQQPYHYFGRDVFAFVPQGNTLFSGTIRDNLLLANSQATDEAIDFALHLAAADFVFGLPQGLDTPCKELGGGLSEGQAQRICIARAVLHEAPILILDESTSALDVATEKLIIQRLLSHCQGKTLIFITHRPAILEHCTQIIQIKRCTNTTL